MVRDTSQPWLMAILYAIRVLKEDKAIFTNVLHKSRVISNLRGLDNSFKTKAALRPLVFSNFFRYMRDSENIAVSLPEKNAERAIRSTR
jgi:hypothetical protein